LALAVSHLFFPPTQFDCPTWKRYCLQRIRDMLGSSTGSPNIWGFLS
jgi:hypothetical protein